MATNGRQGGRGARVVKVATPKEVRLRDAATRASVVNDAMEKAKANGGAAPAAVQQPEPMAFNRVVADELRAELKNVAQNAEALILHIERGQDCGQALANTTLAALFFGEACATLRQGLRLAGRQARIAEALNAGLPAGGAAAPVPAATAKVGH